MSLPSCPECSRPLLVSDGLEMCCHTGCAEFGRPVDQQPSERTDGPAGDRLADDDAVLP